jgi:hypothetical protein
MAFLNSVATGLGMNRTEQGFEVARVERCEHAFDNGSGIVDFGHAVHSDGVRPVALS